MASCNRIGLKIPEQSPPRGNAFYLNEKETAEWIDGLPLANIGETARRLYQALQEFNQSAVAPAKRLAATERFRQPIDYVVDSLNKHYLDVGFPLSDKAHKIAELNRELHAGLATSYKSAISDIILANQEKTEQTALSLALHRAIHHLSVTILLSVLIYDSVPKRNWLELHILYRLARGYNLEALQVKDPLESRRIESSIDQIYRRILLFCLASPYKFRQRDNIQIYEALLDWVEYSRLSSLDETVSEQTIFVAQNLDIPPCHGIWNSHNATGRLISLDVGELIRKLREQIENQSVTDQLPGAASLDKNLLRELIRLWSSEQKRAFMRTNLNFELRVAVGIGNIHQLLQQSEEPKSEGPAASVKDLHKGPPILDKDFGILSRFTLAPLERQNSPEIRRNDFEEFGPNSRDRDDFAPLTSIWEDQYVGQRRAYTFVFQTLNESAGGYCLNWNGERIPKVLVGELIGIQSSLASRQFGIGLIRWMKSHLNQGLQVGVQMIAPSATAVTARQNKASGLQPQNCLLLPEMDTSGQPTSLICPSLPFKVGDLLTLDDQGRKREIKLTRLLESSGAISQFQFMDLDRDGKPSDREPEGFNGDEDFEQLWPTL
jgi:hypothetical protein